MALGLGIEDYKGLIADTEAAIKKSKSLISNLESYYDNTPSTRLEQQIKDAKDMLASEQADLKKYQAALAELEKQSSSTSDSGSSSTTKSGSSSSTVGSSTSTTANSSSSTSTKNSGFASATNSNSSGSPVIIDPSTSVTKNTPSTTKSGTSTTSGGISTSPASVTSYVYSGGDQIITDYQSGEQIVLGTMPTGYIFGGGNFALSSATGTLFIANANDKVINFVDSAGNDFIKAYAATNPGVIDGRGLAGYEYIVGSDAGADIIFAGDGGSQLWGGNGFDADVLVGGYGADMFIGGKYQGADTFMNAGTADVVFLNDATLSDLTFAGETNSGTVAIAFNTGNVVAVQSSEPLSAAFVLADGSAYRFNHATRGCW